MQTFPTLGAAETSLPQGTQLSSTFGNEGEGGYAAFYRSADNSRRWKIDNGSYLNSSPFTWVLHELPSR